MTFLKIDGGHCQLGATNICNIMCSFLLFPSQHGRVPTAQGKQGKWQNKFRQGKHREFGNFVKTQGILFAQVVNSLMPKVKYIAIFAVKISILSQKLDRSAKSVLCM